MVLEFDIFLLSAIIFLGLAYYYIIYDCARKDFRDRCCFDDKKTRITLRFMEEVSKQHIENKSFAQFYKEYSDACEKMNKIKI